MGMLAGLRAPRPDGRRRHCVAVGLLTQGEGRAVPPRNAIMSRAVKEKPMANTQAPAPPTRTRRSSPAPVAQPAPAERAAVGKAARSTAPRDSQGMFDPPADRPDPVDLLEQQ